MEVERGGGNVPWGRRPGIDVRTPWSDALSDSYLQRILPAERTAISTPRAPGRRL